MEEVKRTSESDEVPTAAEDLNEGPSRLNKAVFFMLCAILAFSTIAYGAVDTWALGLLSVLAAVLAVLWIAESWRKRELRFSSSALQLPLLGLLLIGFIQLLPFGSAVSGDLLTIPASGALSVDPYATRLFVIQLIIYCIFFAAALTFIDHRKRLRKMVLFIIIFVSVMAFFGILQRLASPDAIYGLRATPQAIIFGSYVNQHHFAALMEMASGLTLALLFGKATKKDKQMLLIIAALLMGIAIIFTGSRGGLISFFSVLGFILAANAIPRKKRSRDREEEGEDEKSAKSKWMLAGGAAALIVTVFGLVLLLGGDKSLLRGVGLQGDGDFSTGRTHFWGIALRIFWHHPIFGAGLDAFGNAYPLYDSWNGAFRVERAHNEYLQILSDAGILGFSCVAAFIFLFFKKSIRVIRESHDGFRKHTAIGAVAGCLGIMVHSFFDFPLRTPANGFFFLTLAALATVAIYYPPPRRRRK